MLPNLEFVAKLLFFTEEIQWPSGILMRDFSAKLTRNVPNRSCTMEQRIGNSEIHRDLELNHGPWTTHRPSFLFFFSSDPDPQRFYGAFFLWGIFSWLRKNRPRSPRGLYDMIARWWEYQYSLKSSSLEGVYYNVFKVRPRSVLCYLCQLHLMKEFEWYRSNRTRI